MLKRNCFAAVFEKYFEFQVCLYTSVGSAFANEITAHIEQFKLQCQIDMLKEAEEQRLEVLAAAGRYVSHNLCAATIMCADL